MKIKKSEQITKLNRKISEAIAGQAWVYHSASKEIDKASTDHLMGSGVVLTLTVFGGKEICNPVLIRDGLSKETISALKADFVRSFDMATMFKPKKD